MDTVTRSTVQAFYEAYLSLDTARIETFLDDDIDWIISGPVDVLAFCGQRRGKAAVLEIFERLFPATLRTTGFDPQSLLIDRDRVAMLFSLSAVTIDRNRKVSYRVAHFLRFRDNKVFEFRSLIDSFDAAEQLLGHPIDLSPAPPQPLRERRGVVAV
jgi:ketosteroid isomerase-like protein